MPCPYYATRRGYSAWTGYHRGAICLLPTPLVAPLATKNKKGGKRRPAFVSLVALAAFDVFDQRFISTELHGPVIAPSVPVAFSV